LLLRLAFQSEVLPCKISTDVPIKTAVLETGAKGNSSKKSEASMKNSVFILLAAATCAQATLVHFDLSPSGSDKAVGLSPQNVVPAITNSTGLGGTISGGIVFDTDTSELNFAIGYGSAAGFTNLTGAATSIGLRGPAEAGQNAALLLDLTPYNFAAANPTNGGVLFGTVAFPTNEAANLLAGSNYIIIDTAANTNGEIRGQLVPVTVTNGAPSLTCSPASTVECGTNSTLMVLVSDPDGDALTVVWSVNGLPMQTNSVPASQPPAAQNLSFMVTLPLGTNAVVVTATDTGSNTTSCTTMVTVEDTIPPVITSVSANPNTLWPPNHKFVTVQVSAVVTDACGPTTWKITGVSSSEPVKSKGKGKGVKGKDGNTSPDWIITGDHTVKLRAERSGKGNGRVYTISVQATDAAGNLSAVATTTVTVPHDQGNHNGGDDGDNDNEGGGDKGDGHGKGHGNGNGNSNGNGNGDGNGKGNGHGNGNDNGDGNGNGKGKGNH
jgi:hypothetical protein